MNSALRFNCSSYLTAHTGLPATFWALRQGHPIVGGRRELAGGGAAACWGWRLAVAELLERSALPAQQRQLGLRPPYPACRTPSAPDCSAMSPHPRPTNPEPRTAHVRPNPLPYATQRLDADFWEPRLSPYRPLTSEIQTNTLCGHGWRGNRSSIGVEIPQAEFLEGSLQCFWERGQEARART